MSDMIEGTSPRGVLMLTLIVPDGADGIGDGGSGTDGGDN